MRLSILEVCRVEAQRGPRATTESVVQLAQLAEQYGYHRMWLTEHHAGSAATAAPDLLIPLIASQTESIRVGVAGVLLGLHPQFVVAERFAYLSRVFEGRIDLGVARGRPPKIVESLLAEDQVESHLTYRDRVAALVDTIRSAPTHLVPGPGEMELWLHGSGTESATIAGELGVSYCHAMFLPKLTPLPNGARTVAIAGLCSHSEDRANVLVSAASNREMRASVVGEPERCAELIHELVEDNPQLDEIVFLDLATRHIDHINSYVKLAEALR